MYERWGVTKWCDGVRKMVCDKVVCERWCVCETKMVFDKVVRERWCV